MQVKRIHARLFDEADLWGQLQTQAPNKGKRSSLALAGSLSYIYKCKLKSASVLPKQHKANNETCYGLVVSGCAY